ncbi:hypothetical protein GCM10009087_24080 [Sphingomonas oligophenolica]|uniref:DUF2029 domain-containing protein n=1 Tax=Sphingomonas oligophenolica TaxID=301154 RepID=A0ABU9Y1E2_9SPHN
MMSARIPAPSLPPVAITLAIAAAILWWMMPFVVTDMDLFFVPWLGHIAAAGPVAAFARPFSNYAPGFLYFLAALTPLYGIIPAVTLIKLLCLAGTAALAFAVRHLLILLEVAQPNRAAALVLALPSVLLNAGPIGQCDAFWAAPLVMALAAAISRRHASMLVWCGLALGFKVQAVLFAPFVLALLINRRVPFRLWSIAPAMFVATMLPAWAAGWPASDLAMIYLRQAVEYPNLSFNAPNIWAILQALPIGLPLVGVAFAVSIGATAGYIARFSAMPLQGRGLIPAALLAALVTTGLLPHMHERYFFLADVLALLLALVNRDRASWTIAILVQAGSTLAVLGYLSGIAGLAMLGGVAMIVATIRLARTLLKPAANDNPLMVRAI